MTSVKHMDAMTEALCRELELQAGFLDREVVRTVYFGGGTPSLLNERQLKRLMDTIRLEYDLSSNPEVTLEANPDDLKGDGAEKLRQHGINRLSIGIQSFHDPHLQWMNRVHSAREATDSFYLARSAGFENISIDLMYAIPHESHDLWKEDLSQLARLRPEHVSAYSLTIEPQTAFGHWVAQGKMPAIDEAYAAEQFELLLAYMKKYGYEQYEISNFAQPGYFSQHNSNYWKQEKYLGIGPSAHSYNGSVRYANIANNTRYVQALKEDRIPAETIPLSREDQVNEYILTSLRTRWGCDLELLRSMYNVDLWQQKKTYLIQLADRGLIEEENACLILTDRGKLLADKIASDLFIPA